MGLFGTSNRNLATQITAQGAADFKSVNNLLTLQENHVEEFFTYHGEHFLTAMEKLMEDVIQRVVSQMLVKLRFAQGTSGEMVMHADALREYETITAENITLDLQMLLASALNSEVVMQRKLAKKQYLESQGYAPQQQQITQPQYSPNQYQQTYNPTGPANPQGMDPSQIQGGGQVVAAQAEMQRQQQAFNNPSGFPVQPAGYDTMGNPYWIDPATGQASYTAPGSGLGLGKMIQKGAAWAAWLS
tara:strand:- start:516 stop:1250 length:735 start_codon:yes stop_codon:yes gene_type:complete